MAHLRTLVMLLLLVALAMPVQAKKDKTKGLPAARNNNVPEVDAKPMRDAKLRLGQSEGKLERAQDTLKKTIDDLRQQSASSPVVAEAQNALRQAQADYDAATAPILEKVRNGHAYHAALEAKTAAAQHVEELQAQTPPNQDEITQAARVVLEKGRVVTQFQSDALASDPKAAALKANLDAANVKLLKIRHDLEESIKINPQVIAARKEVEQAQSELTPVKAAYDSEVQKYNQAMTAREKALNDSSDDDNGPSSSPGNGQHHKKKPRRRHRA
jgi:chromosome segregation ATPase